jgi:hypothetical protein
MRPVARACATALVAVEAESCALADALATALLSHSSIDAARDSMVRASRDGNLPSSVHRISLYARADGALVTAYPHAEARHEQTGRELRDMLRAVPAPVAVSHVRFDGLGLGLLPCCWLPFSCSSLPSSSYTIHPCAGAGDRTGQ